MSFLLRYVSEPEDSADGPPQFTVAEREIRLPEDIDECPVCLALPLGDHMSQHAAELFSAVRRARHPVTGEEGADDLIYFADIQRCALHMLAAMGQGRDRKGRETRERTAAELHHVLCTQVRTIRRHGEDNNKKTPLSCC